MTDQRIEETEKKLQDAKSRNQVVTSDMVSSWLGLRPKSCDGNTAYRFCIWREGKKEFTVEWKSKFKQNKFLLDNWRLQILP